MNTRNLPPKRPRTKGIKNVKQIKQAFLAVFILLFSLNSYSQNVGISAANTPADSSAGLDVDFTNKGLLIPRVSLASTTDVATIPAPATSLLVYNINTAMTGGSIGYWYWSGSTWTKLLSGDVSATSWLTLGNGGTASGINFLGTTDSAGLSLRTNNAEALHIDSLQNVAIGVANTTNKFEVAGSFKLHQDSFNLRHTTDLFPSLLPGVQFIGATYRMPLESGTYINGIADIPPAGGDITYSLNGYIDLASNNQNLFLASIGGMLMNSQSSSANSSLNLDNAGNVNLYSNRGNDTSTNMNFSTNGINFFHSVNAIGNTNIQLNDSSVNLNINENVTNSRNSNVQIRPNDYNVYNNDNLNSNSSAWNFSSLHSKLYLNSSVANSHLNLTDSTYDQYTGENATGRYTGIVINPDNHNLYNNDNANGRYSSTKFNSLGYNIYINSPSFGSNFSITDSSAFFTSNAQSRFGIGTSSPSHTLHVSSYPDPVRFEGLQSGSSSDNLVTIDANGILHTTAADSIGWALTGNGGTTPGVNFLGTTDNQDLQFKVNNVPVGILKTDGQVFFGLNAGLNNAATNNIGVGANSLGSGATGGNNVGLGVSTLYTNTTGLNNVAVGLQALFSNTTANGNTAMGVNSLYSNTSGNYNTGIGINTLYSNNTGYNNVALGIDALYSNTTGHLNVASGASALYLNTTGFGNTASGYTALYHNTEGYYDVAVGSSALFNNITGNNNTAIGTNTLNANINGNNNTALGSGSLYKNTSGSYNSASGVNSLASNTAGANNTASGYDALYQNTTGNNNTASGNLTLLYNITGDFNSALGSEALKYSTSGSANTALGNAALIVNSTGSNNTALGYVSLATNTTGSNNTALGYGADVVSPALTNATAIGYSAIAGASNSLVLGGTGSNQVNVGVGTSTPNSYLETAGSFAGAINIISTNITLNATHYTIIINSGVPVITLPAPANNNSRRVYNIINRTAAAVTISAYNTYGGTSTSVAAKSKVTVQSNGINWYQIN